MDAKELLGRLPEPPVGAEERVWSRVRATRDRRRRPWILPLAVVGAGTLALASVALLAARPEAVRHLEVDASTPASPWSDRVSFGFQGRGSVEGTSGDVEVAWAAGTLRAEVAPGTGTRLAVITEEARVDVVGTVFHVTRDRLGSTTTVERGRVRVACADGWSGEVGPEDGPVTCLPTGAVQLLSRADALADQGASDEAVLAALDAGLAASAPDSTVRGEILVRRMERRGAAGRVPEALADARAYLGGPAPRAADVNRHAGWLAVGAGDCASARVHLEALGDASTAEDRVLLAECLASGEPARARALAAAALPALDADWSARARSLLGVLEGR